MRVVLHVDPKRLSQLLGIWVWDPVRAAPRSFYPATAPEEAVAIIEGWMEGIGTRGWDEFAEYLSERLPYSAYWSFVDVEATDDLEVLFVQLAAEVVASAVAMQGQTMTVTIDGHEEMFTSAMLTLQEKIELLGLGDPLDVAKIIVGPTEPFTPVHKQQPLSSRLGFFADDHTLLVVARRTGRARDADLALAHGLAYRGDRDLWVAVPREAADATLARAVFLVPQIRVWTYSDTDVREEVLDSVPALLNRFDDAFVSSIVDLGDRARWVRPLVSWADHTPGLDPAHRSQYLAWHCQGRGVLIIRPSATGLTVIAGVNAKAPQPGHEPVIVELTAPIEPLDVHRLIAAASRAAAARLDGTDAQHLEHRLQAVLRPEDLGLLTMQREFPAWRRGAGRGFIDFLGVDARNRIHIVETKIGADDMLIPQGLDYWIWANAHKDEIRTHFGLPKVDGIVIDYVVAPKPNTIELVSAYSAAQAEALAGEISWRFHDATSWAAGKTPTALPVRTLPAGARRTDGTPPRWAMRLAAHLNTLAAEPEYAPMLTPARRFTDPRDGLLPAAHAAYVQLASDGLLHSQIAHLRSSQAFALNLFAPLDSSALQLLWEHRLRFAVSDVTAPELEYLDPLDTLGEATAASPHATQVDVVLRARTTDGRRIVALIEVKLSEDEFNRCSAYQSIHNPNASTCRHDGPFGNNPASCFQLANHGREQPRRYDEYLLPIASDTAGMPAGCWYRRSGNQIMRNIALGGVLLDRDEADHVVFAVAAPEAHATIWRRFDDTVHAFAASDRLSFARLPATAVVQFHSLDDAETLCRRYLLDPQPARRRHAAHGFQQLLDEQFPDGGVYRVEDDGHPPFDIYDPRPIVTDVEDGKPCVELKVHDAGPLRFVINPSVLSLGDGIELQRPPARRTLTRDLSRIDPDVLRNRRPWPAREDFGPQEAA